MHYLPLKNGTQSRQPEICAIDLARGRIRAILALPNNALPGNLLPQGGQLLSQTATTITGLPLEK